MVTSTGLHQNKFHGWKIWVANISSLDWQKNFLENNLSFKQGFSLNPFTCLKKFSSFVSNILGVKN